MSSKKELLKEKEEEEKKIDEKQPILESLKDDRPTCGIIMPIAGSEDYPASHWDDVKNIIISVADEAGFNARLVSDNKSSHIIQKTIVQNIYFDDIVICDVSSKNPNVMFELGMRLAFDKATIIIKDLDTGYSFDTSPVEHLNYRKDLRYFDTEDFKSKLLAKLHATYRQSKQANKSMYLDSFGKFEVKGLKTDSITDQEFIIKSFEELKSDIKVLKDNLADNKNSSTNRKRLMSINEIKELYRHYYDNPEIDPDFEAFYNWLLTKSQASGLAIPTPPVMREILFK